MTIRRSGQRFGGSEPSGPRKVTESFPHALWIVPNIIIFIWVAQVLDRSQDLRRLISGVVRRSAAWGENKKCRPCLYFIWLLEYDSGRLFWLIILLAQNLNLVQVKSEALDCIISRITDTYYTCHGIILQPSHTLGNFEFNTPRNPSNSSPDTPDKHSLANSFLQFLDEKIERICSKFSSSDSPDPHLFPITLHIYLISILPLSRKFIISFSPLKTSNAN